MKQTVSRHALGLLRNTDIKIIRGLIYLAQALAPRDYCALATMLSIPSFATLAVDFVLGSPAVRYRVQAEEDRDAGVNVVPTLRLGLAQLYVPGALIAISITIDASPTRMLGGLLAMALLVQVRKQE